MKKILALVGSVLIISGCFFPILRVGENDKGFFSDMSDFPKMPDMMDPAMILYAGVSLIGIAALCILLTLIGKTKWVWAGGLFGALTLAGVYFGFQMEMEKAKEQTAKMGDMMGAMAQAIGISDLFSLITIGGSGWYVIGTGILLLILTPFIKK